MDFEYIKDQDVSSDLDQKLRQLLSASFLNGNDPETFSRQRYYNECPQHRYLLWDNGNIAAHIAVHDKRIHIDDVEHTISGIAEVCVNREYRKQGLVKQLLERVLQDSKARGDAFSILFGEAKIYGSSGYVTMTNLQMLTPEEQWVSVDKVMVCELHQPWPKSNVQLVGKAF
ncbi:GNAT family N-acetyltransferase [Vibrio sp. 10N.261.55.A7]|uniref:GNAT family N-acetyltransferase n=1 Tax=Vibrio sp. 10N.261.55.A7 TaxID=1880851 RepID=UPI000C856068|nr:GNAT family N-acetyltransferase [Vibrio sp. 10N.261.55.A7]PMK04243.1 GNAT family N-acetyltransferase [Vibrio sp. 10N.261.55.A7]